MTTQDTWNRRLGCRFDPNGPEAHRARFAAFRMCVPRGPPPPLPSHVDLRQGFPPVTDQTYNCCVAESTTAAFEYAVIATVGRTKYVQSSRMFLYYQARLADNMQGQDDGAFIHSAAQSLLTSGLCEESFMPYSLGPLVVPPKPAYTDALDHKALTVKMVDQNLDALRQLLASGYPVVIGFVVFPSIQSPTVEKTGDVPMPSDADKQGQPLGGHAVVLVGYDDSRKVFIFRNSWGTGWGDQGYGSLPYAYLLDPALTQDFWVILSINDNATVPDPAPDPAPAPAPTPDPNPVPVPPPPSPSSSSSTGSNQPVPPPGPASVECCATCDPWFCCCARTRLEAAAGPFAQQQRSVGWCNTAYCTRSGCRKPY